MERILDGRGSTTLKGICMKTSLKNAFLKCRLPLAFGLLVAVAVAGVLQWSGGTAHGTPTHAATTSDPILWKPCGQSGAECGQVSVPLDWSQPDRAHINLAVAMLHASQPSQRVGTLLWNPGGPGEPGVEPVVDNPAQTFPAQLMERYDIVGFDP